MPGHRRLYVRMFDISAHIAGGGLVPSKPLPFRLLENPVIQTGDLVCIKPQINLAGADVLVT